MPYRVTEAVCFLFRTAIWVIAAHTAVDLAAMARDLAFDDPQVVDARFIAGVTIAFAYGVMSGRRRWTKTG